MQTVGSSLRKGSDQGEQKSNSGSITLRPMVVLALETATRAGSYALWDDGVSHATSGDATRMHGQRLPGELLKWLATFNRTLLDVDLFAVVTGPGSFTGLRVGVAAIQGLAMTLGRLVVPIPTLEALASGWMTEATPAPGTLVGVCLDGQRGDVFYNALETGATGTIDDACRRLEPAVSTPDVAADALLALAGDRPLTVIGSGIARHRLQFERDPARVSVIDVVVPLAGPAAALAARHPERAVSPHALRPLYVRRPDADLARDRTARTTRAAPRLPPGWTIVRAAGTDDLSVVEALQKRAFTNAWGAEAIRWELENTDVARLYLVRDEQGATLAYCACWMVFDELHINSLAVDEPWRRHGVATILLAAVIRDAVESGAKGATLEVRQSNIAARALYEGLGFRVEGVRRDYYQNPREDALVLWNRRL